MINYFAPGACVFKIKNDRNAIAGGPKRGTMPVTVLPDGRIHITPTVSWLAYKRLFMRSIALEHWLMDDANIIREAANLDGVPLQNSVDLHYRATRLEYSLGIKATPGKGAQ